MHKLSTALPTPKPHLWAKTSNATSNKRHQTLPLVLEAVEKHRYSAPLRDRLHAETKTAEGVGALSRLSPKH